MFLGQLFMLFQPIPLPTLYLLCVFTVGVGTFTVTLAAWCADGVSALALEQEKRPVPMRFVMLTQLQDETSGTCLQRGLL